MRYKNEAVPDAGDVTLYMSLEYETMKVLLAIQRRLAVVTDDADMETLSSVNSKLDGILRDFTSISGSASDTVKRWCEQFVEEQKATLSHAIRWSRYAGEFGWCFEVWCVFVVSAF